MKKIYLAILGILLFAGAGTAQTVTINCTGTTGSFNSGYVTSAGAKTDGNMIVDGVTTPLKRGWATFDLSSIPTGSTINSVTLKFTVTSNNAASGVANEIHGFSGTPSAIAGATLYANCISGTNFNNAAWTQNATNSLAFNAAGITFISGALGGTTNIGFVRGAGSSTFNIAGYPAAAASQPQLVITYTLPAYRVQFSSLSANAFTPWCAGEVRTISLTVKNLGSASWLSNAATGVNFSYWWSSQSGRDANPRILPFTVALASGQTQVLTFSVTAPASGTPTLNFDLVKEASFWFGDNTGGGGPGNFIYTSTAITVNALPASPTGSSQQAFCSSASPTVTNLNATGTTIKWYAASSGGSALATSTALVNGTHYYASQTNASGCESSARLDVTATVYTPLTSITYSVNPAVYCPGSAITANNPTVAGGTASVFSVSPALPAGLILNTSTGVITGTPTTATAAANYTITASNTCGSVTVPLNITISPAAPNTLTYTSNTPIYCIGAAIANNSPSNSGGASTSYSVSPALPAGLSIDPVTGIISGTPTVATPSANYTVTATNSCGSTTKPLTITVTSAPATTTYSTNPVTYCAGQLITNNSPTTTSGGAPTAYSVSPALPAGLTINPATGIISGTPTTTAGIAAADYTVTASNTCGSTTVAVNITISPATPSALTYTFLTSSYCVGTAIANNVPSNAGGAATGYSVSPALPAGLSIDPVTGIISGTPAAVAASATYTVTATNSCGSTTKGLTIAVTSPPVIVAYSANPATYCAGQVIINNSPTTTSGGAPTAYSVSPALPAGLALNAATGVISGTPTTTAGIAATDYTVTASNTCGSATVAVNITISPAAPSALTYTLTPALYCVGTATANNSPSNSGGAATSYSVSPALPAGLSIDPVTGIISGTPTVVSASASYTVTASNSCGSTTKALTIAVTTTPSVTYSTNPAIYCAGVVIANNTPTNTGGAVTTYSVSPALPAGLVINAASGIISGTPTTTAGVATATYTVSAANSCGTTTTGVVITISPAAPSALTYTLSPALYCVGTAIANNSPSNSGGAATGYSVSPALPAGLSIDPVTGIISGTPIAVIASATYTVTASNSCGSTTKALTIAVTTTPSVTYSTNPATYCAGAAIANNTPTNTGGAVTTYSVSPALPAGLAINSATGIISGSPTTTAGVATATYTVSAANSCGTTTVGVVITISPAAPNALTYSVSPAVYCLGSAIANNVPSNGGGAPTAYSVSPALPAGLSLNTATGVISGTPTSSSAAASYTITASNSCGSTTKAINITVNAVGSWIGVTSTNWFTASNWGCGIIPDATIDVIIPATGVTFQPNISAAGAVCRSITINGSLTMGGAFNLDVYGDWINNGTFTSSTSTITFKGSSNNSMGGTSTSTFYNLIVNKTATANTVTSITKAFNATNLTITQGDLILTAIDASYIVAADINVPATGILTDNVNWDGTHLLSVGGNIFIDGIFNYNSASVTPHVTMVGAGNKTVRTGANPASGFGFLTLQTGAYSASGPLVINSNFWAMFGTPGSFSTAGQTVTAKASLLIHGGTVNINGGILNVTGGMVVGYPAGLSGIVNFSSGTLNADAVTVGPNTPAVNGVFNQTGGVANIGDLIINNTTTASAYICTGSPIINMTGNWTNNETFTAATSQVNFIGTALQTIGGTSATTFNNFKIANATGISLATNAIINTTLDLTNGLITTPGANVITVATTGNIINASGSSYVNGKLARGFAAGAGSKVFPIGKGGNYRPLTFAYSASSLASTITAEQFESTLAGTVTPATVTKDIRYWEITKTGTGTVAYTVTLDPTYAASPVGSIVQIIKKEGNLAATALTATPATTPNYTNTPPYTTFNNSATASGINDFALGSDCSSLANAGPAMTAICQGGTSAPLGGLIVGTATGGTWTDGGVGGTFNPNATTLNATWTPPSTYFGTATLTLTPTGGICPPNTPSSKTILVNGDATISLTSAIATTSQTLCINTALTAITYQLGGGATGAALTGAPAGVSGSYNSGTKVYTVSGTPTASGSFTYTVTTTGPCIKPSLGGTITVTPDATITLSSASGTNTQTVCQNIAISNITYTIGGSGTGATVSGLPTGVSGLFSGSTFTISGTPSVAGTFNYTVTTTGPCAKPVASGTITVLAAPSGAFTATENSGTANDNSICAGDPVTFTAPSGYPSYTFYVNGIKVQGPNTTNIFSSSSLTNGQSVTVNVANSLNCGTTFGPIVITVIPPPAATLSADKTSICPGDMVTFTAGGGTNYNFKLNGSSVQSGSSNIYSTSTFTAANNPVTVDVTNSNGCTATSAPVSVTVNSLPSGTLTSTATSVCAGGSVTFTATSGFNGYNFKVNGNSAQNNGSNVFITTALTNPSVVTVDVTNVSGCTKTFNAIAVTVNPLPIGTLAISENSGTADDGNICANSPVTFTATSGYNNYAFYLNGTGAALYTGPLNAYTTSSLSNNDYFTVVVTSGSNCTATFTSSNITVVPSPAGTLSVTPSSTICAGDNVTFTAPSDPTFTNYLFKLNGTTTLQNGAGNTYSTTSLAQGDIVTVDITNTNSCVTTFNAITMTVNPLPTGTLVAVENSGITPDDGIICIGAPVVFTAPSGFSNYNFIKNNVSVQSGASNTYTPASLVTGDQVVVALTSGSCIGLTNTITVTINPLPAVSPITSSSNFNVCETGTTTLSDLTPGGTWSSANTSIATVDPSTGVVTGVSAGTVSITYTTAPNLNGCTNATSAMVTVNAPPTVGPITGNLNVCVGSTSPLSDATPGGTWTSNNTLVADVDAVLGLVDGRAAGTAIISYTVTDANGCTTVVTATVLVTNSPTVAAITTTSPSSFNVCIGGSITVKDATPSGTWSSSNPLVATINSSGIVTGLTAGTTDISYTIITSCFGTASATQTLTVNAPPSATIAYGGTPYCSNGGTATVTQSGTTGGTYSKTAGAGTLSINASTGDINIGSSTPGTYTVTYTVAASGGCSLFSTTTSVTITSAPSAVITYSGSPYCSSAGTATVTRTGTSGGTYSKTAGAGTLSLNSSTGDITLGTSTPGTYTITYTVAAFGGCAVYTTTADVTITAAPLATISYGGSPYCTSVASAPVTFTGTAGGTYSSTSGLTINSATGAITPSSSTGGIYTVTYTVAAAGGCSVYTTTSSVTVTPTPTVVAGPPLSTCSNSGAVNITGGSSATNYSTVVWTSNGTGTFANANSLTTATYTPSAADIAAGSRTLTLTANGNGSCAAVASSKVLTINAPPAAFTLTPASANICQGDIQSLLATSNTPTTGTLTFTSSPNIAIPDGQDFFFFTIPGTVTTNLSVSTIPAGAIITGMSVNFNVNHTYDQDLVLNLRAPNGNVLNLVKNRGAGGDNFTNTTISSTGVNPVSGATAPFTGTYTADNKNNVGTPNSGNLNFPGLYSVPNGIWTFGAEDDAENDIGRIISWSLTFTYTVPVSPINVVWSPTTGLYTDPGATTAYSGAATSNVYAKPNTTTTYAATVSNGLGCSTTQNVTVTVKPLPVVTISADYCARAGFVRLTATSSPAATSYVWSTGQTGSTIDVDIAGDYDVTAFQASGCPGTATISVANELVINGNFEAGNTGFTTPPLGANQYQYRANVAGNTELVPEGLYGVGIDGQNYHGSFWGHDHTTGSGNYMIVNGFPGSPQPIIWQETVTVLPNTTYYFSAWGMSVNGAGNYAQLQFNVNGAQVGSVATLGAGVNNNSNNGWTRFYGTLTTGPSTTSAVISITDLQTAAGGNDFGLDDISFSTLSTFINLESAPGTDAQTPCINTAITPIVYSVGSSASSPIITPALPAGLTSSFNGVLFTISGTPTVAGSYAYTITTTGACQPSTASGTINVQAQKITLSSGNASPSVCANTPMSNIIYTLSGTATNATTTGLPAGVTGAVSGSGPTYTYTISGTPTAAAGTYPYTITTSGTCAPVTFNGTITVTSQTITLNSALASTSQTVCINSPITNIQYTIGGTGTGATVAGLPGGVSYSYNSGILFINGSPTASGTFGYTVTTSGTCTSVTATGTITVTPNGSFTLTSGTGSNIQTTCVNAPITPVTYTINNATGYTVTGLPAGVTGSAVSGGSFTLSGSPTATAGTYNYTVTTSGGCGAGTATGSITIQSQTISLTSGNTSPTICVNTAMTPIVYTIGGTATGASLSGQPAGVNGVLSGNTFTISGTPTASGPFNYTVTLTGSCVTAVTATGTITVSAAATGGTLTSVVICGGGSGTLTLSGQLGTIVRWESSTDNFNTIITPITNTTISLAFTNISVPTQYRVVVGNGCGNVFSSVAAVNIHNYWTGATDTDWNTASNWSDNQVPSTSCPMVYIPNTANKPILSSGTSAIVGIQIFSGASLTVTSAKLQIAGSITNSGIFDAGNGAIEFNGTSQTVSGSLFKGRMIKDLIVTSAGTGLSLSNIAGDTLNIAGSLTFGNATADLNTNGNITLKSTALATASVGVVAPGNIITGDVTVERYIGSGPFHPKSWQLLAIPTWGAQTIKQSWQEGCGFNLDCVPGYGTQITGAGGTAAGFDMPSSTPSMKTFSPAIANYVGISGTGIPVYNQKGYFVFVRGNRSSITFNAPPTQTVLRTKGALFTPANPPPSSSVLASNTESVGNPYASAIDKRKIGLSGVDPFFIVWDPSLGAGSAYGLGAFQYFSWDGTNYTVTPGGGSYGAGGSINNTIESGQAFFVQTTGVPGTVSFDESAKVSGSMLVTSPIRPPQLQQMLRTNLYGVNPDGSRFMTDGTLSQFGNNYSNSIDGKDARKNTNTSENLSIKASGILLAIERRQMVSQQDTIFLNLTGVRAQPYRYEFIAQNMNVEGLEGFVEDNYLHTRTPLDLSGTTLIDFTIANIAGSYAADRFRIVFAQSEVLPVTITDVKAYRQDKNINVEWKVENERNIKDYTIEKSADGIHFTTLTMKAATGNNSSIASYQAVDDHPVTGYNYYRIRSNSEDGKTSLTQAVKVLMGTLKQDINIYPNPITDGMIHLQFLNEPEGKYGIRLLNKIGQVIVAKQITRMDGNSTELIKWDFNLAHGMYQLEVTRPDGSVKNINVLY